MEAVSLEDSAAGWPAAPVEAEAAVAEDTDEFDPLRVWPGHATDAEDPFTFGSLSLS